MSSMTERLRVEASMSSVTERLRVVVARTFRLPIEQVDDATTPAAVAAWDSLGQLDLVTALEQEFSVEFGVEEIMLMNSVGQIRSVLERRNGAHG
jgi:acyl carrier protein